MTFELNKNFKSQVKPLVQKYFTEEEFETGFSALEKLLNINGGSEKFGGDLVEKFNKINLYDSFDLDAICMPEGFLEKIEYLKGNDASGKEVMLRNLYTNIGFYDRLNNDEVIEARRNDPANSANAENVRGQGGFSLDEAKAEAYRDCPGFFEHYIVVYQFRNKKAHDNSVVEDPMERLGIATSIFVVYLDQCIKNSELIFSFYKDEMLKNRVDYKKYANEKIAPVRFMESDFIQLDWLEDSESIDNDNSQLQYSYDRTIKFIGEPGLGKTTQMRRMYYQMLCDNIEGRIRKLPIWIDLADLASDENPSIRERIKEELGEYSGLYNLLLENDVLALFLDGYNEVIVEQDKQDNFRKSLAREIDDYHNEYPQMFIAMTDRKKKSNPPCLTRNVAIYTSRGMSREQVVEYSRIKHDTEMAERMSDYLDSDTGAWFAEEKTIPTKVNALLEMLLDDIRPENNDEFYNKYLEFILEREAEEKKETRIEDLKYLLSVLATDAENGMANWSSEKSRNEITRLWMNNGSDNLEKTGRLFDLAVELSILGPGETDEKKFSFTQRQYYYIFLNM